MALPRDRTVTAYLGIGSNVAPERNVPAALELLRQAAAVTAVSNFYQTTPVERPEQAPFYNGVAEIRTDLPLRELKFSLLRGVEQTLGRVRTADKHAPRPIDLDVLLYGNQVVHTADLRVPDPDIYRRPFVAAPLLELAPELVLPDSGRPLRDIVAGLKTDDMILLPEFSRRLQVQEETL